MPLDADTRAQWERYEALLRYEDRLIEAREDFGVFCQVMMPGDDPNDPLDTKYIVRPLHQIMFDVANGIEAGTMQKVIISMPPRSGKSHTLTTLFSAWQSGLHPDRDIITASYNQDFAESKFSKDFLDIVTSHRFAQVFPDYQLDPNMNNASTRRTMDKGSNFFAGRGGTVTGLGGDLVIGDDLFKNAEEARLPDARDRVWDFFLKTLYSRLHDDKAACILTATRWTADDHIGRIIDPSNQLHSEEFAKGWHVINLPALAYEKNDPLGREIGEALWPDKFSVEFLKTVEAPDPVHFSCLYQGNPVPDSGIIWSPEDIFEYDRTEYNAVKDNLKVYCYSDHAYGTKKVHDPSVFMPVGVSDDGSVYILPDIFWDKAPPDQAVDQIIDMMVRHKPLRWFAERGHIFSNLLPLIRKRMEEERVFCVIDEVWPKESKANRAIEASSKVMSAVARCQMGKIKFPAFAPWWPRAQAQMLQFPNGNQDDFVDVLTLVGLTVDRIYQPSAVVDRPTVQKGTYEYYFGPDDDEPSDQGSNPWIRRT